MTAPRHGSDPAARLREWYPCTLLLLGAAADGAIERFGHTRAADWLSVVQAEIAMKQGLPEFTRDVAAYEAAVAALASNDGAGNDAVWFTRENVGSPPPSLEAMPAVTPVVGRHVRVEHFAYNAPEIVAAIENCDRLDEAGRPAPCTIMLMRAASGPGVRIFAISDGVEMVLGLSDGSNDCAAIVGWLRTRTQAQEGDGLEIQVWETLRTLRASGALVFHSPAAGIAAGER
jgi:hypothetical protein